MNGWCLVRRGPDEESIVSQGKQDLDCCVFLVIQRLETPFPVVSKTHAVSPRISGADGAMTNHL